MFEGRVLALDLATVTGFAYGFPGSIPQFGDIRFNKPGGSHAAAYRAFRYWLEQFVSAYPTDLIVFESAAVPSHMLGRTNVKTTKFLFGLSEHLEEWCYDRIELREATVSQVRCHFIGSNMKSAEAEPETITKCKFLGWDVENHDQADACALWDYQCGWLRPDLAHRTTYLFHGR
jgi:hypothetical protein